ncbi:hypothetical protein Moror_15608 [Moniliophthora roreri MCA 2997]|uniref:Uncharacterized protein n=1 Tax=Moniliophthora roreri (strain MCA 2997) TaxID=1381753 RepID=V2WT68_MONRO|nr:hypothetical protein Moror_15608 [Moniliophthora roreri MCA 2997]
MSSSFSNYPCEFRRDQGNVRFHRRHSVKVEVAHAALWTLNSLIERRDTLDNGTGMIPEWEPIFTQLRNIRIERYWVLPFAQCLSCRGGLDRTGDRFACFSHRIIYKRIPTVNIIINKIASNTEARRYDDTNLSRIDARRIISSVRVAGEDKASEFLHVRYSGCDAFKVFKRDFEHFSRVKDPNVAQLFGYNDNQCGLLALIFYDALIPVTNVLRQNKLSSILYAYFEIQLEYMVASIPPNREIELSELWVDPRTGACRGGPYVPISCDHDRWAMNGFGLSKMGIENISPLSIQTLSDNNAVLDYLTKTIPTRKIVVGIGRSNKRTPQWLADEEAVYMLRSFANSIYNRCNGDIIARWGAGVKKGLYYRFMITLADLQRVSEINLQYALHVPKSFDTLRMSWLAQAYSIFSQLQIPEDKWEDYSIHNDLWLSLRKEEYSQSQGNGTGVIIIPPVYLFIQPVPCPSADEQVWRDWVQGKKFFWSFDPSGAEKITEPLEATLGLPAFTCKMLINNRHWHHSTYDIIENLHIFRGFNPSTADPLNLPVLRVRRTATSGISKSCNDSKANGDRSMTEGSIGDERILYPRLNAHLKNAGGAKDSRYYKCQ